MSDDIIKNKNICLIENVFISRQDALDTEQHAASVGTKLSKPFF